eukprot:scaffold320005_cov33-Tisochrysis_lutea.AAC.1
MRLNQEPMRCRDALELPTCDTISPDGIPTIATVTRVVTMAATTIIHISHSYITTVEIAESSVPLCGHCAPSSQPHHAGASKVS